MDKSGVRVHLMFLEFLRNLRDPPQYSWGSGCLAWLYRELCWQAIKRHRRLVGHCNWSSIGHGRGCHSCARGQSPHLDVIMAHGQKLHLHLSKYFPDI